MLLERKVAGKFIVSIVDHTDPERWEKSGWSDAIAFKLIVREFFSSQLSEFCRVLRIHIQDHAVTIKRTRTQRI